MPWSVYAEAWTVDGTTKLADLPATEVLAVSESIESWGGADVTVPVRAADVADLISADTETWRAVHVFATDGTTTYTLGQYWPQSFDGGEDGLSITCADKGALLARRHVGRAGRTNALTDASFESGTLTDWPATGVTASADNTRAFSGSWSALLDQATAGQDTYISQDFTSPPNGVGVEWTITARVWVSDADWVGPATGNRGLFVQEGTGIATNWSAAWIRDTDTRDQWRRLETTISIAPNTTATVQVRLYAPGGKVWWDDVQAVVQESLSYPAPATRQDAAQGLLAHAQDTAYGKSDLGIGSSVVSYNGFDASAVCDRTFQFYDHPVIATCLDEIAGLEDGGRWRVLRDCSGIAFDRIPATPVADATVTFPDQVTSWRWTIDAGRGVSSVCSLSPDSDGPDREEGGWVETSAFGGVVLEEIVQAPSGTPPSALDARASAEVARRRRPATMTLTCSGVDAGGVKTPTEAFATESLQAGMVVQVDGMTVGSLDMSGLWQATSVELDVPGDRLAVSLRWLSA